MAYQYKLFLYSSIAALSSFLYGLFLTSLDVLYDKLKNNYENVYKYKEGFETYKGLFATIVFLGAFASSCFIYLFEKKSRKEVLIFNNLFYLTGSVLMCVCSDIYILMGARLLIGAGAGISCCTVPSYIFSVTNDADRGFYMSFHSIGIVIGLVLGKLLVVMFNTSDYLMVYNIINLLIVIHTIALFCIKSDPKNSFNTEQVSIMNLITEEKAYKSIFLALSFHFAQHACGIDFFSMFSEMMFTHHNNPDHMGVLSLAFSALISIIGCNFIDKWGRRNVIVISTVVIIFSTFLLGFGPKNIYLPFIYLFGFNIGMSSIPWFIINEIFPPEYLSSALRLSIGFNWLSAFVLSFLNKPLFDKLGHYSFFFNSGIMCLFLIIVLTQFKETKNTKPGFQ